VIKYILNHIDYEVNNIYEEIKILEHKSFKLVPKPCPGFWHNNRLVFFLYSVKIGIIELIEKG
jgi:hypothetical protein